MTRVFVQFTPAFLVIFIATFSAVPQEKQNLRDQTVTVQMTDRPLGEVLRYLMEKYDVPIGYEESIHDRNHPDYLFQTNPAIGKGKMVSTDGNLELEIEVKREFVITKHPITVNIENGTLGDVMDKIVGQMKYYKWEINNDVVNIVPIQGRDERFKQLLETKIGTFTLKPRQRIQQITYRIMALPTFRSWMEKNHVSFNPARTGSQFLLEAQYGRVLDEGMKFSGISFRQLFNEITKRKRGGWILRWKSMSADGKENIDLDI